MNLTTKPTLDPTTIGKVPLSFEQERMWLLDQLAPDNPANHIRGAVELTGPLDSALLAQSINQLIKRHEILRTHFAVRENVTEEEEADGQPVQVVNAPFPMTIPVTDLRSLPVDAREAAAQRLATDLVQQPFDLTQAPLWRLHLLRLAEERHLFVLCMHHIICDGDWSLGIFFRELALRHEAARKGQAANLLPLPLRYRDFAVQQRATWTDETLAPHLAYWQQQLGNTSDVLQLPIDRPRPTMQSYSGANQTLMLSSHQVAALKALSVQADVPLFVTLLATVKTLLYRYTGQEQIAIGSPTAGRLDTELDGLIGYFGNPVVLQTELAGDLTFRDLLQRVHGVTEEAEAHQRYPFQKLVKALNLTRDLSTTPLFQVLFVMQNAAPRSWSQSMLAPQTIGELTIAPVDVVSRAVPYELFLSLRDTDEGLRWLWEYNSDLFDDATITRMIGHCQRLLDAVIVDPDQPIGQLPLLTDAERQQLLVDWNDTQTAYPQVPIHKLFEEQVERTPDVVAVHSPQSTVQSAAMTQYSVLRTQDVLTYRDLNDRANQLAHHLQSMGIGSDDLVAICIERSPEMLVGILGILKAGGAYAPLDADYPVARLTYMLADSGATVLLTTQTQLDAVPQLTEAAQNCQVLALDTAWATIAQASTENPASDTTIDHLIYAIYTSGSTGQPKGAALPHRVVTNLVCWHRQNRLVGTGVRMLQVSPISFDVSAHEIFATLCSGGTLVLVSDAIRRNPFALVRYMREQQVEKIYLPFIALQQLAEAADVEGMPTALREVITAGEQLQITPAIATLFAATGATFHNDYGGTEIQDVTALTLTGDPHTWPTLPSIGRPIDNVQTYILDAQMQPVPIGVAGELYIGGDALAQGYLNRPDLNQERFIEMRDTNHVLPRLYKTNDLVRYHTDGTIEHLGRIDNLVKIRGFRIELGEIETTLMHCEGVREAVVTARDGTNGQKQLTAYVVPDATSALQQHELLNHLRERLPDYMVPAQIVLLDAVPLTPSGKVNRRALPEPETVKPETTSGSVAATSETEEQLIQLWQELLQVEHIDVNETFFELGGNSLLLVQAHKRLVERFDTAISSVTLFQYPTIQSLAQHLKESLSPQQQNRAITAAQTQSTLFARTDNDTDIAIIGMACRFPGASNVDEFWQNLRDGVESISLFTDDEIALDDPALLAQENYIKAGAVLADIDRFDAAFFGYSTREAEVTDPQQRLLLECAWEAFEEAGYNPELYDGQVGVYTGSGLSTYLINNVAPHLGFSPHRPFLEADAFQAKMSNDRNYYPTRISYKLNLTGPSLNIQTACSTSLVTVHMACQALLNGECDMALAGGSAVVVPHKVGYPHHDGMIHSPDGHTRAFDADAQGTLFGNGVGMVALKRRSQAEADGDNIIAIIRGSAMNNDGAVKVGYTAPSVDGQAAVITKALDAAGVDASTIGYVETHGTATALGDPIEVAALSQAFCQSSGVTTLPTQSCAIGSVKTNIGHLDEAAGIAGLIKAALALQHKQLPPSLHFQRPNPQIDFENGPFYVNTDLCDWQPSQNGIPRRAGVSSFGMGGTNCHIVLEEAAERRGDKETGRQGDRERPWHLLALSAQCEASLRQLAERYVEFLETKPEDLLADICFTANVGRKHFEQRRAFVATSLTDLRTQLITFIQNGSASQQANNTDKVAFLFTGQGSQYVGMGQRLYETHPSYRQTIHRCNEILQSYLDEPLLAWLHVNADDDTKIVNRKSKIVNQTQYTQPALFALEYALIKLWLSWGIEPTVMMGHSVGEYVAACVAGVFSLEDGLKLIAARGRLMQELTDQGSMIAVKADEEQVTPFLAQFGDNISIAAVNGPQAIVLSGRSDAIATIEETLTDAGVKVTKLAVSHAFHSALMEPMLDEFAKVAETITYSPPRRKLISNVTGKLISDEIASADYWVRHIRQPVRFADGVQSLRELDINTLIEVGPKPILLGMAAQSLASSQQPAATNFLASLRPKQEDWQQLLRCLGTLYEQGVPVDWAAFYQADKSFHRVPLPTYPFQRQRYWVEADKQAWAAFQPLNGHRTGYQNGVHANTATNKTWLYEVEWRPQAGYGQAATYLSTPTSIEPQLSATLVELNQTNRLATYSQAVAHLESLTVAYILATFQEMGWTLQVGEQFNASQKAIKLGIIDLHHQLFGRFLAILAEERILAKRGDGWQVIATPDMLDPQVLLDALEGAGADAETTLLTRCGTQLVQALRGECDPVQLLFPGGDTSTMLQIYRDSPILKTTNLLVQQAVLTAIAKLPAGQGIRILEIGAGAGGTASHLLPHLPADRVVYHYTDVSAFFIAQAEEKFQEYPFVQYDVLDIEQDPLSQGFEINHFDLIVAADVLHATRDMHQTMTHVRKLLVPDGLLVLMEDTTPLYWIDLTFGLTEGWWRFTDRERRPDHPLLSTQTWQTLLQETGFVDVTITATGALVTDLPENAKLPNEAVIVARADVAATVPAAEQWLIFADQVQQFSTQLVEELSAQHQQCTLVTAGKTFQRLADGPCSTFTVNPAHPDNFERLLEVLPTIDNVVHCWSLDETENDVAAAMSNSVGSALHLVQALLKVDAGKTPRLWLVTQGAQAVDGHALQQPMQSSLWGLGKIIALEHPELCCTTVDLESEISTENAQHLAVELLGDRAETEQEDQLAFRGEQRYVARLAQADLAAPTEPLQVGDGSYLITGGLGGLGLLVAAFLVERGASHLVLLGRSEPSPEARSQIDQLEAQGAMVTVMQCDVSNRAALADVFAQIDAELPPLRGVVHAAGLLDDGTIQQQRWSRFETVMAPKAYGAWYLHELTQHQDLYFFVLFSSSSALLGTAGQANHVAANTFLDALAAYRHGQGLPALSINWGAWAEVGATARMGVLDHLLERGEGNITPEQGIAYLELLLCHQITNMAVMPVEWPRFLGKRLAPSSFFADFVERQPAVPAPTTQQSVRQQLEAANPEMRRQQLTDHVGAQVIQVVGWNSTQPLDPTLGFFDLGMDSLTSIELRNRLNRTLECTLPVTLAFDYPTVAEMVVYLEDELFASPAGDEELRPEHVNGSAPKPISTLQQNVQSVDELSDAEAEALLLQELEGFEF